MPKYSIGAIVFVCTCALGIGIVTKSWEGVEFYPANEVAKAGRDPAAIRKNYDFSELEGSALIAASKRRLLEEIKVFNEPESIGIELGHFVVKNEAGEKSFACQRYDQVVLTFEADGFAVNGERSKMEVYGPCEISADINRIAPIWIPVALLKKETPADGEIKYQDGQPVTLKFSHILNRWPNKWFLSSVRLVGDPQQAEVNIGGREALTITQEPVSIQW